MDVAEGCGEIEEERSRRLVVLGVGTGLGWDRRHWVPEAVCVCVRERGHVRYRENEMEFSVVGNKIFVQWEMKDLSEKSKILSGKRNFCVVGNEILPDQ